MTYECAKPTYLPFQNKPPIQEGELPLEGHWDKFKAELEQHLSAPIHMISTGPEREDCIEQP
jgi:adenylosuccinate synthase